MSERRSTSRSARGRIAQRSVRAQAAFALPLVLLLAVVAALGIVVLLERHSVTYLAMVRQIRGYGTYHQSAGLREVFNRWMPNARGRVRDILDEDGLAFRLNMPKTGRVSVYMHDGQGTLLKKADGLAGRQREILEDALAILNDPPKELAGLMPENPETLFRTVGPGTVSVYSADQVVIEAICLAVLADPSRAREAATAIVRRTTPSSFGSRSDDRERGGRGTNDRRPLGTTSASAGTAVSGVSGAAGAGGGGLGGNQIGRALMELNIDARDIREIESMFVENNTVWWVEAETEDGQGNTVDRAGGLYEAIESNTNSMNQNAGFLTWEALPLE